jgi:hypothetical protein
METEGMDITKTIIKFALVLLIGVVLLQAIDNTTNTSSGKSLIFSSNPTDGQTISVDGAIYEFDSGDGVTSGHIPVNIGYTQRATLHNLAVALRSAGYEVA